MEGREGRRPVRGTEGSSSPPFRRGGRGGDVEGREGRRRGGEGGEGRRWEGRRWGEEEEGRVKRLILSLIE